MQKRFPKTTRIATILSNSLTLIGILGIALMVIGYFVTQSEAGYLFAQIAAITGFAAALLMCWVLLISGKAKTGVLVLGIGSGWRLFQYCGDLWQGEISGTASDYLAGILISIGIITVLNSKYLIDENSR